MEQTRHAGVHRVNHSAEIEVVEPDMFGAFHGLSGAGRREAEGVQQGVQFLQVGHLICNPIRTW